MNELVEMIQIVGFPIVAFLMMYVLATKTIKENTQAIRDLTIATRREK